VRLPDVIIIPEVQLHASRVGLVDHLGRDDLEDDGIGEVPRRLDGLFPGGDDGRARCPYTGALEDRLAFVFHKEIAALRS